jgi:hypothetical protein
LLVIESSVTELQISCVFAFFTLWKRGTTCSQIYFRFSSYLLRKLHLFVILTAIGWFIVNIQSDLFWHRCLERWKRVKTHVISDQSVHITHTYCCVSKLSKSYHHSTDFSSIFSISFHYSTYFSSVFFSGKIWKIWKKSKLKSEKIRKIWKKSKLKSEKIWETQKEGKLNSETICFTIQLGFLPYFDESSKCCDIRHGLFNYLCLLCFIFSLISPKKSQLNGDKIWKVWKKNKLNSEKIWKIWKKRQLNSGRCFYVFLVFCF